nr:putative reverse transcriptase domain-containing protein [Tanacetum cinerariifolium]
FDRETSMIYAMIEEKQDDQALQRARVNRLFKDRRFHAHTARLIEGEARASRKDLTQSMDASDAARSGVIALRTQTQLTAALGCIQILKAARVPAQPDKMAPQRTTRANPTTITTTTTTSVTDAQLKALIEQGVSRALAARDADRNTNGDDSHVLGTCARRTERVTRECIYPEFMKNNTWAERQAKNKRKFDDTSRSNQSQQQQQNKRGTINVNTANNHRGNGMGQKPTCYECGSQGHFRKDCTKFKNNNRGTQGGNATAPAKVYAVGRAGTNPDSNVVTGTFLLSNHYTTILFDTGADRSFVSTAFSSQIAITSNTLDYYYDVKLADGRIIGFNSILRGCTLNFLNHPFNIDLMPVELGIFDAIIGMDWLVKYHAVIVCAEKIVRITWGNEILIVHGDGSYRGNETRLNIISYAKMQKYLQKGCHVFLAHITTKETEDKSEKKLLEDVPIVRNFPKVFPEDLSGLPLTRQVEFQIDLIPGSAPVVRAPYRLAPSEMKELSKQLQELSDKGFIRPSSSP